MNPDDSLNTPLESSWASAFFDGEALASEQAGLSVSVHEQIHYYTLTRQVIQGQALPRAQALQFHTRRASWAQFWLRVDHHECP